LALKTPERRFFLRKIIHIDMDAFYAAIEVRDNPDLQGKPVAVGGRREKRGVLSTCNYEARKYGLHSAMPTAQALNKCPDLILIPGRMDVYKRESARIRMVFAQFTDLIEPLSLDEAYLDVTDCKRKQGDAPEIARTIRQMIQEKTNLTASAGIAPNKMLAKIASDWNKPNGQFEVRPEDVAAFMQPLSLRKIPGVGKVTAQKLQARGFSTCGELQSVPYELLDEWMGKSGRSLWHRCRGRDDSPIQPDRERKSLSVERTFSQDLETFDEMMHWLPDIYQEFLKRYHNLVERGKIEPLRQSTNPDTSSLTFQLFAKIKYADFSQTTIERKFQNMSRKNFAELLRERYEQKPGKVRLFGLGVRFPEKPENHLLGIDNDAYEPQNSSDKDPGQLSLF